MHFKDWMGSQGTGTVLKIEGMRVRIEYKLLGFTKTKWITKTEITTEAELSYLCTDEMAGSDEGCARRVAGRWDGRAMREVRERRLIYGRMRGPHQEPRAPPNVSAR